MRTCFSLFLAFLLLSLIIAACQNTGTNQETATAPSPSAVAALAKSAYSLGDSVVITLSKPLSQVTATWDGKPVAIAQVTAGQVSLSSAAKSVGLHQLVISGTTADKERTADTMTVDLWSDIKPQPLAYSVLQTYPHQTSSFTQGLEFYEGELYESTGQNGQSRLMKIKLQTGAILQSVLLPDQYFGEGITIVNDRIYQLTWTSGRCFRYSMNLTLEKVLTYHTQGWGLTHRNSTLIVSDGSNRLSFYTPDFQKTGELVVYDDKGPVRNLNELEYIDGIILANVWQTNRIVRIDAVSGKVTGDLLIDAPTLVPIDTKENVLNGIAYQPTENALYITGKNWPFLFRIQVKDLLKPISEKALASR